MMKKSLSFGIAALCACLSLQSFAQQPTTAPQATPTAVEQPQTSAKVNVNVVNINTASAPEIQDKLVGIGAKKAQAIVDYREKNGKFISIEQLTDVSGIGKATLDKNRDRIVIE